MTDNNPLQGLVKLISEPINRSLARASTPAGALRETITVLAYVGLIFVFWGYSNKFLGMSADYITSMSRDISVLGVQRNLSFYPMDKLMLYYGGLILMSFLLIQNEFRSMFIALKRLLGSINGVSFDGTRVVFTHKDGQDPFDWSSISTSLFGIIAFIISYVIMVHGGMSFSPGTQVPFFFLGGALLAGVLLLQNNIPNLISTLTSLRAKDLSTLPDRMRTSVLKPEGLGIAISLVSIVLFVLVTLNMPMFQFIANDIPEFLSAVTLFVAISWSILLSREGAKPSVQSKRTAALAFFVIFPFVSYLLLRLIFLQNDGTNATMLNRWEVRFDFMEKVNTFKINPWPMEAEPNQDSRWVFLKAGIINSARVTLVSIFLCTVLGVIVGVTRLSTNKLASTAATVYVEVFRNLPLAVLLFLISSQMGAQLPYFIDEYSLVEISTNDTGSEAAAYISNEGTWVVTFGSFFHVSVGLALLMLLRVWLRFQDLSLIHI